MDLVIDKINQGLNRVTFARNEIRFCESILSEKKQSDKLNDNDDYSPNFYSENSSTLGNLFNINLRMAITDLYTLISKDEANSYIKINNTLKCTPKIDKKIQEYNKMIEYLKRFDEEIIQYNEIIESLKTLRNVYVAHTDGSIKRIKYKDVSVNVYELKKLILFLFSYYFNIQSFVDNSFSGNIKSLFTTEHIGNGSNNHFQKMSRFYKNYNKNSNTETN